MADQTETGIWKMRGKVTLTPGAGHHADRTGACCYRFGFVNVTGDDICDLTITSSNLDALERAREILADTEPKPMKPGVKIWRVVYKAKHDEDKAKNKCLHPQEFFDVVVCFSDCLRASDVITFFPSDSEGAGFASETEKPEALTWRELAEIVLEVLGLGAGALEKAVGKPSKETRSQWVRREPAEPHGSRITSTSGIFRRRAGSATRPTIVASTTPRPVRTRTTTKTSSSGSIQRPVSV